MADTELKKAFQELQFQTGETKTLIAQGEVNKKNYEQQKRMSELTSKALSEIPTNLNVYQSVGRMFVLSSKDNELKRYLEESKKCRFDQF
ncbi:unnamed protein product [Auanema sp. JU1783]|nr:unnamed protein product [Auanema sp. JU1783]